LRETDLRKDTGALSRARIEGEKGAVKKGWGGRLSIAIVYPNYYRVGMSNLGFQVIYALLNKRDDVVAERAFLPEDQEMSLRLRAGRGLFTLESQSPLRDFDIVAFSISFENDYPNVLAILESGKIPLLQKERDQSCPIIMAGGITTFLNPEPVAMFFDLFLLGEAETNLEEFIDRFKEIRAAGASRKETLEGLEKGIPSVYVPSLYNIEYNEDGTIRSRSPVLPDGHPKKMITCPKSSLPEVNRSCILTKDTEFSDTALVELGRGCGRSCRFCAAGYVYRPPRVHNKEKLIECAYNALKESNQLGLLSASVLDTPGINDIFRGIIEKGGRFSVSSLRAELLTEETLECLKKAGQKSLAIAPEAGSERLRMVINKHLTNEQIIDSVRLIARVREFSLRLYFLIGLPRETRDDLEEILSLVKVIRHHMVRESKDRGTIGRIRLSVNCFIPKAFTPFQWFPMEGVSSLKEKQKWLKKSAEKEGGITVSFDVAKWAYMQTLLSMGDRRVGSILMLGHRYKGDWPMALRHSEINPDFFVLRPRGLDEHLPWDFIDHGIRREYLAREYMLALKEKESDICAVGDCDRCGVCRSC
jgi:radical SAM superfamily enzyme YgiQ (UPF0313 family)